MKVMSVVEDIVTQILQVFFEHGRNIWRRWNTERERVTGPASTLRSKEKVLG